MDHDPVYQDHTFSELFGLALDPNHNHLSSSIVEVEVINHSREHLCNHIKHSANPGSSNDILESATLVKTGHMDLSISKCSCVTLLLTFCVGFIAFCFDWLCSF